MFIKRHISVSVEIVYFFAKAFRSGMEYFGSAIHQTLLCSASVPAKLVQHILHQCSAHDTDDRQLPFARKELSPIFRFLFLPR